ncbi:hypothetical protein [Janthinobacterium sp. DSP2-3-3]|uniref:hypothetical protein n=1 Tax=Janthinobacterium sp. DSP2-3-3 TaxID=2804596 RepID=UPI003CF06FDC
MSFSFHKLGLKAGNTRDAQSTRRKARKGMPVFTAFLLALAGLATALLLGMVIALGAIQLTIMLAGLLIFIPILLFVDTKKLLPLLFVVVFFASGTAQYFFNLRLATWMASGLAALFFARTILEKTLANQLLKDQVGESFAGATRIVVAAWIYLAFYAFSIFMGHASTAQLISVLRFCLPMFGVLFAMYWFEWSDRRLLVLWGMIVVIALAQLPLALYQHFFNIATMGWDSVVGSFGGNMSPVLVLFTVVAMLYVLARWVQGITPVSHVVGMFIIGLAIILLGEVKAVFIWLPFGVFWVVRRKVLKNILVFVMFVALMCSISSGIFMAYHALYWGNHTKTDTMEEKINSVGGYVVDPNGINYVTGEISRGASLVLWYLDPVPSIQERLIGYGPSASSTSQNVGRGYVAARYRNLQLGATGLASLLWDVGILGTLAYLSIFILGILQGARYVARSQAGPERLAMADASTVTLILLVSTLIYNRTMIDEPAIQLLCYFSLGCIVQFSRYGKPVTNTAKVHSQSMPGQTPHGVLA